MGLVPSLYSFSASTPAVSAQVNSNFTNLRDVVNTYAVLTDVARTITAVQTFTAVPVFSNGATITAGGLTVSAGGITATGNSTITGTLGVSGALTEGGVAVVKGAGTSGKAVRYTGASTIGDGTLSDNGTYVSHAGMPRLVGAFTTTGTVTAGNTVSLTIATSPSLNVGTMWAVGNPTRITIPADGGGLYRFTGWAVLASVTNPSTHTFQLAKGGVAVAASLVAHTDLAVGAPYIMRIDHLLELAAGDYVEFQYLNGTAGNSSLQPPHGGCTVVKQW